MDTSTAWVEAVTQRLSCTVSCWVFVLISMFAYLCHSLIIGPVCCL